MTHRKALGKGLEALIPGGSGTGSIGGRDIRQAPVERIVPNRRQPRASFDSEAIDSLARSIAEQGVIEPLIVRPNKTPEADYELVAGERRWRAAMKAGLEAVPVIVKDLTDQEALEIALIENIQRQELNAVEEARGYKMLNDEFGLTQEDISKRVGVERSTVANSLRLLKLETPIVNDIASGKLSAGHARALLAASDAFRMKLWTEIIGKGLTVRQAELLSQKPRLNESDRAGRKKASEDGAAVADMSARLGAKLGAKVKIKLASRGGVIEIRCANRDELEGVFDRILGE